MIYRRAALFVLVLAPVFSLRAEQTARQTVLSAMEQRPRDPWPRGMGHVVLGLPGSLEIEKGFHEPGGSLSPSEASFGVSIWITDAHGSIHATSDSIPLDEIQQQWKWTDPEDTPGILTVAKQYQALWSITGSRQYRLDLDARPDADSRIALAVRSTGPAGDAIYAMRWNGQDLLINGRWTVAVDPVPAIVYVGEEGSEGWIRAHPGARQCLSRTGWCYARLELPVAGKYNLLIKDAAYLPPSPLKYSKVLPSAEFDLPDPRFADCFNAQSANLMMTTVGQEIRVGDTTSYPLAWARDGAYVLTALARLGHLDVAKQLSRQFAENDFFGGFGPEADAPGLALWALEQVALRLNDREHDRYLWPHVERKVDLIYRMLSTDQPIYRPLFGMMVPEHRSRPDLGLVCDPTRDGLIVGRMDFGRPLLHVNGITYRGLLSAAEIAGRLERFEQARKWRARAAKLQEAWFKAFNPPESEEERTYISALWPMGVAGPEVRPFLEGLERRWAKLRDEQGEFRQRPLWTYFDLAEAHQWLLLGRPDRSWKTIEYFWTHQPSPGLYTFWEGNSEENSYERWKHVRGWVKPPHVTPDNWAGCEMLMLQADMMAYSDPIAREPTLVIGAGIPADWMSHAMSVKAISTDLGVVDWTWQDNQMNVVLHGQKCTVRLGLNFNSKATLKLTIQ
jgi:hypothetical protein